MKKKTVMHFFLLRHLFTFKWLKNAENKLKEGYDSFFYWLKKKSSGNSEPGYNIFPPSPPSQQHLNKHNRIFFPFFFLIVSIRARAEDNTRAPSASSQTNLRLSPARAFCLADGRRGNTRRGLQRYGGRGERGGGWRHDTECRKCLYYG